MKLSKSIAGGLKLLITLLLLLLIFHSVDLSAIRHHLQDMDAGALIVILALCWIGQLICSERWRIIAASLQLGGSYPSFVKIYFAGMFFNIGLPSLIGGDFIKAYILSQKNHKPLLTGLISVLLDRAAGLVSLLFYGTLAIALNPMRWRGIPLWIPYAAAWTFTACSFGLVLAAGNLMRRFADHTGPALLRKAIGYIIELQQSCRIGRLESSQLLRIALFSFANSGLILWALQRVTVAAGHPVDIISFCALFPLVILATMLPVTLGGLGVREWVYVEALSLVGIPRISGLVVSLATSATLLLCNFAGLIFLPGVPAELRRRTGAVLKNERQL